MKEETTPKRRGSLRRGVCQFAVAALMMATLLCAMACSPQQSTEKLSDTGAAGDTAADASSMGYKSFYDVDAGDYPNVDEDMVNYLNDGARGCNACHEDLWEVIDAVRPEDGKEHLATGHPTYGRNATWNDCYGCHQTGGALGGKTISDMIHVAHYSSQVFAEELGGNCYTCHAMNLSGEFIMYDFFKHSAEYGGWVNASSPYTIDWADRRHYETDTAAGVTVQSNMAVTVDSFTNDPTPQEDRYVASNYGLWKMSEEEYSLNITGVKNPRTFTLAELKELPQTEQTIGVYCFANWAGSYQVANIPMKGVLLKDLIEACGGVEDGVQSVNHRGVDGWAYPSIQEGSDGVGYDLQYLLDCNAMLVLEEGGEPLKDENGYPAEFVMPGCPAGSWTKWCTEIDFLKAPGYTNMTASVFYSDAYNDEPIMDLADKSVSEAGLNPVNVGFFTPINEGEALKAENGVVTLKGYAYNWNSSDGATAQIDKLKLSADYGRTWTEFDVPASLDPSQLITWTASWSVDEPGTYVLYAMTESTRLGWNKFPVAITVNVEM